MKSKVAPEPWLRGPQNAGELDLTKYHPLARKFAHRYGNVLGYDDALSEALVGLCLARNKWDPSRAPFGVIARYYISNQLRVAVDALQKDSGVPFQERVFGKKKTQPKKPQPRYTIVSGNVLLPSGEEEDILDHVPDEALGMDEVVLANERDRRVRAAVEKLNGSGGEVRALLEADEDIPAMTNAVRSLSQRELDGLRRELADLVPGVDLDNLPTGRPPAPTSNRHRWLRRGTRLGAAPAPETLLASREDARAAGRRFYLGKPCVNGHSGCRYVASNTCPECDAAIRARRSAVVSEERREWQEARRKPKPLARRLLLSTG